MKQLYMAVTADKYELPIYVTEKSREMAEWAGVTQQAIRSAVSKKTSGRNRGMKYVKVNLEENL